MSGNGTIYIAGMDEGGGGFPHNDTNLIYKSTDGGATWSNTYTGTPFPGPGVTSAGYFACMFNDNAIGAYWRHEGWGEPAAFNNIVHLVYAQHGDGSDAGDVYYIRSTDGGVTFGTPLKLNTDATTRPQWQPNLSVSPTGTLLATWYDARESADCVVGDENTPCYRMWSRKSNDNGQSWLPDDMLSDVVSPLPAQPDPGIVSVYVGDYDYGSAIATKHVTSWADGRVAINSASQQDAFTDRDLVGFAVTTADPACGSLVTGTAPTAFTVDLSDPVAPGTVQPSDFTVNGISADGSIVAGDGLSIEFDFNSSPVIQGENTMHIPAGAFNQASNNDPVLEFQCTFRYGQEQLVVVDTDPPVGGTFTPPAPGTYDYLVNLNMAVDPSSVQDTDLQLSGNAGATVTGHSLENGDTTIHFTLNISFGGSVIAHIAGGAITDTFGNPNADFSGNYTVEGIPPCIWSAGSDLPFAGTRFGGVFFPTNGKFYAMGGRDVNNVEFTHPFEYDPVSNSWTTKSGTYPDGFVSNTECAVLNDTGTDYIYCVGGSSFATQTSIGRVFRYDPVADVITTVPANWPPGDANVLPGGISVFNNKVYILGGFIINTSVTNEIWEFTPNPAGWVQKGATLPVPRAYIPTTTIGKFIYTGGGADWDGATLQDTTDSFKYDPAADSISPIASIPRATSNTRALNFCNLMYVMGGAFNLISNEVDVYDPVSDTWSIGTPFATARRNAAYDTDGTNNIWLAGGYDSGLAIISSMEIFNCPVSPCGAASPTPTPTATATATATATVTPTATPTATPTPPRQTPTPRPRPTPFPRPTP
jgi:Kelch motif